jgi:hypothetical protein
LDPASHGEPVRNAFARLRRLMHRHHEVHERCELCGASLGDHHAHLVETASRRLVCSCEACAVLFSAQGAGQHRRVPRRTQLLRDFRLSDEDWAALALPIDLAFLLPRESGPVAVYPSPGGATESAMTEEAWSSLLEENPILGALEPDVEALLINRLNGVRECYRLGIDECYRLVGVIRTHWRGFSGGTEVWREIDRYFDELKLRSP